MTEERHDLTKQIKAAAVLRDGLAKVTDDSDAIRDTIEGETTLHEAVRAVLASMEDDEALVDGLKARIGSLDARKKRFEDRIGAKRALVEQALMIGEIDKMELDLATVFLRPVPAKANITEESEIPSEFWQPQPPKLDTKKLLAALKDGPVPGASLSNGGQTLAIRRA